MKALVILNSPAANGERQVLTDALSRHFAPAGLAHEIYETRKEDRLEEIVRRRLSEGFDRVIAAGGDGTVSAVGNGLIGSSIPLGIIPIGTGNLIARELGIPADIDAAIALIAGAHRTRRIDAMQIGARAYVLNVSVGISASVVDGTTKESKSRFGRIAYFGTALLSILLSRPRYLVVEVDGKAHPYRAVEVAIMNCGLLGKLYYPKGPDVLIDDGQLGVWILGMKTLWDYPRFALGLATGWAVKPEAHFISAQKTVSIRSNIPLPVQADGDMIGTTPINVAVMPGALTVMTAGPPAPAA